MAADYYDGSFQEYLAYESRLPELRRDEGLVDPYPDLVQPMPRSHVMQQRLDERTVEANSTVFEEVPSASFFIGVVAIPGEIMMPAEYKAWLTLRGKVYVDEKKYLTSAALDDRGLETDEYDHRSVQFAVLYNQEYGRERPRLIGGARLILKQDDEKLPVERIYSDCFEEDVAPISSTEASRLIARHPKRSVQSITSMALIRAMAVWTHDNGRKPVFAIIEEDKLGKMFQMVRLPYRTVSEPRMLPEYNTTNTAIAIDPEEVLASIRPDYHINAPIMRTFYKGVESHKGLGYFDDTFIKEA